MLFLDSFTDYDVSLEELKAHCFITHDELDTILQAQVEPAVSLIENEKGIALREKTWLWIDSYYPDHLPYSPTLEITEVKIIRDDEPVVLVEETDYRLLATGEIDWLQYPDFDDRPDAIQIKYVQKPDNRTAHVKRVVCAVVQCLLDAPGLGVEQIYGTASFNWLARLIDSLCEVKYV